MRRPMVAVCDSNERVSTNLKRCFLEPYQRIAGFY